MPGLTKTEIANLSLLAIGQGVQIEDYDSDMSAAAKAIRQAYPVALKIVLGEDDWHFARQSAALVAFGDPTVAYNDRWMYAYHLPSNCVEFRGIDLGRSDLKAEWELWDGEEATANGLVLTNVAEAIGRYTFLQASEGRFPMWFCDALALKAGALATPALVPGDYAKRLELLEARYRQALDRARVRNLNADRAAAVPASEAETERT